MDHDREAKLHQAARAACGEPVTYQGFFPIVYSSRGVVAWRGIVSLFVRDSGKGGVYAWVAEGEQGPTYLAAVQKRPINTPLDAVRSWLASEKKK